MNAFFKKMISLTISALTLSVFMLVISATPSFSTEAIEEEAETVLTGDSVIAGEFNEYRGRAVIVDGTRYFFCSNARAFSPRNRLIALKDIEGAEEVKLFINDNCVRKIKVLRFAE